MAIFGAVSAFWNLAIEVDGGEVVAEINYRVGF